MDEEQVDKQPIDTSFEFTPQNPFTMDVPASMYPKEPAYPGFPLEDSGFLETAKEEFKATASSATILHAANKPLTEPAGPTSQFYYPDINDKFYKPAPPGWTPKSELEKQTNIDSKFIPRLLTAKSPADFNYILSDSLEQQHSDHVLQNGSTLAKVIGGGLGYTLGSIENIYPLTALATKAKVADGFISGLMRNVPGITIASGIREGAKQMDAVESNLSDFLKDTFIDTSLGVLLFGAVGAGKSLVNLVEFNKLKAFAKESLDGIGFNFVIDKKGNAIGFEAVDTTGGSLGAARVTMAQEMADSAFYKGGLFKIPYVGTGALHVLSGNIPGLEWLIGSPLVQLKLSKYRSAGIFADAGFDHFLTTEGEARGGVRPQSFEFNVKKTKALLTNLKVLTTALHMERNGYEIKSRPAIGIANAWAAFKQKALNTISKDTKSTEYSSEEDFMDEVQQVLYSENSSEHAAVNTAATIYRNIIDTTFKDYRKAYNLPDDWMPPKTAVAYLMRVYDIKYLEQHEGDWIKVVSNYLKTADQEIETHLSPIREAKSHLAEAESTHQELIRRPNITKDSVKRSSDILEGHLRNVTSLEQKLQDDIRNNPDMRIHVDDWNALSSSEAKELDALLLPLKQKEALVNDQKKVISDLKAQKSRSKQGSKKSKTVGTAKKHVESLDTINKQIDQEEDKLHELQKAHEEEYNSLQDKAANNEVNPRFFTKDIENKKYHFRDSNERLKFRDVYESDFHREQAAKGYYDSIMNMNPQDIIADVFGRLTGNKSENVLKQRTLMIPDEILYNNKFMTKDLYAKTANYVNYLSRRTHLKNAFKNVTVNGGFEEIAESLLDEYKYNRSIINNKIEKLSSSLEKSEGTEKTKIEKKIEKERHKLTKEGAEFDKIKRTMHTLYETRMMGLNKISDFDSGVRRSWMSITAAANLHNLPATQLTDVGFIGFQHGIWPSIRDGIYPMIESMGGILETKDSEALRKMAPHINLGYQDVGNHYADRNWNSDLQPYFNMGKIVSGIEKFAHFSALTDLTPYFDNGVQRANGGVIQSNFMEFLHNQVKGTLSEKDSLYLRKYGIDPKVWGERMVKAYQESGGFQNRLGGYISKAWQWQDLEAANLFNDGVFRGIQNTLVWRGMSDSPFFADNILGLFFHTFTGWMYAATNRYLIPSMQHADAELLLKVLWMAGAGALVSPTRRIARGEDPWPKDMTATQIAYEAWSDSGLTSILSTPLNLANYISDDKLLGNLKNDKYRNRVKTGIFGMSDIVSSTANRIGDVIGMAQSGLDEKDLKTAARMLPITGSMYLNHATNKFIEGFNLPRNKRAAEMQ